MKQNTNSNALYHHGIKGQRWGIRRYQNKDGSLTPAGRKRVAKMKDEYTALTGKRLIRKPTSKNDKASGQNGENKKKTTKEMSDTELRERINRLQMEKQVRGLESDLASKGEKFATTVGKQVIAPAAIDAGKRLLTDLFLKIGKEKLGLNPDETKDAFAELRKEVDELELHARKAKAEKTINSSKQPKESKKTNESKNNESKAEKVKTEFVNNDKSDKTSNESYKKREDIIIDAEIIGETFVDRYKDLRLPAIRD